MRQTCVTLISFCLIILASCQAPDRPKIYLYDTVLPQGYPVYPGDSNTLPNNIEPKIVILDTNRDITGNTELINIMRDTRSYCVDGVWRFFSDKDYMPDPFSQYPNGITLGEDQHRFCKNTAEGPQDVFASMKSFRYLGPLDWTSDYSMAVFDGYYYSGKSITVVRQIRDVPMPFPVVIDFVVKSFVITAPIVPTNPNKICSSWLVETEANPSIDVCYNLCACPGASRGPKMFMQGVHNGPLLKSLRFVQYYNNNGNTAECSDVAPPAALVDVPSNPSC